MDGIGGELRLPEDFIVKEVIERKFLSKFARIGGKVKKMDGPYSMFLLKKRGLSTKKAVEIVAKQLNIKTTEISYAGLKDKFVVTSQYITIKGEFPDFAKENVSLTLVGKIDRRIFVGDLIENKFIITLHNCKNLDKLPEKIKNVKNNPVPNYFGPQRFAKNNDEIGKKLLRRELDIKNIKKGKAKFYINAYQSHIFNKTLSVCIKENKVPEKLPLVGYNTKNIPQVMQNMLDSDKISTKNFEFRNTKCVGSSRMTLIYNIGIDYSINGNKVTLKFSLPKGSYATIILNKIQKGEYILTQSIGD